MVRRPISTGSEQLLGHSEACPTQGKTTSKRTYLLVMFPCESSPRPLLWLFEQLKECSRSAPGNGVGHPASRSLCPPSEQSGGRALVCSQTLLPWSLHLGLPRENTLYTFVCIYLMGTHTHESANEAPAQYCLFWLSILISSSSLGSQEQVFHITCNLIF